jgi:predicted porin
MKKSLFAIAAVTAFAGAAQAQSSVTVYGILDVGYVSQNYNQAGVSGTNNGAAIKANSSQFGSSAETTSRLGFRGNEDLGGGTSAFFTIEVGLTPTNGSNISGNATGFNNRQTFVGLAQKGIGRASIGTQYTPIHEAVGATSAGQQNNMPGDIIYPSDLSTNSASNSANAAGANGAAAAANAGTTGALQSRPTQFGGMGDGTVGYTVRSGNSFRFMSDSFAGFRGKAMYVAANSNTNATSTVTAGVTTQSGGNVTSTGWGLGLDYTIQKLLVSANAQQFRQQQYAGTITNNGSAVNGPQNNGTATAPGTGTQQVLAGTSWGTGLQTSDNQMYFAATYDFGILKAYAQYISRKAAFTADPGLYSQRTAQQIGVRGFVTSKIETWASGGMGKVTNAYDVPAAAGQTLYARQSASANISAYQLGANYWLSKRTNLYGIFGQSAMANVAYPITAAGSTANSNSVSSNQTAYAVGVRHTF